MSDVTLQDVERFIEKELPAKIQEDLRNIRMAKEADLESLIYFHMRTYFQSKSYDDWRIFARKYIKKTRHYVDLLLFENHKPVIAIELKKNKRQIETKDRCSLYKFRDEVEGKRCYFIATMRKETNPTVRKTVEDNFIKSFIVPLGYAERKMREWNIERRKYTSQMGVESHEGNT